MIPTGLGLGLAIVRHLVELHGGSVAIHSDGPGKGTAVSVALPVRAVMPAETSAETPSSSLAPSGPALEGVSVLVVDDQDDARDLISTVLEDAGAQVVQASSVAAALRVLAATPVHVLVSDISMPAEDGYTLIRRVRTLPGTKHLPALALTAYARAEDRDHALAAGFQHHAVKPIDPPALVAAVRSLVGRSDR